MDGWRGLSPVARTRVQLSRAMDTPEIDLVALTCVMDQRELPHAVSVRNPHPKNRLVGAADRAEGLIRLHVR